MAESDTLTETKNWYPDEHTELVNTKGWTGAGDALSSYSQLEKSLGARVKMPTAESAAEEITAFYSKLGRPENPEGYALPVLPEGKKYDDEFMRGARATAFETNTTSAQFTKWVEWYLGVQKLKEEADAAEKKRAFEEADKALHEKWREDYDPNFEIVERACVDLIPDEALRGKFAQLIDEKGLRNHPVFGEVFLGIGKSILDDTLVKGEGQVNTEGDKGYKPANPNSPDMYATGEDEDSKKARAYFRAKGHTYDRDD